jgi:ATP-dependent Clp protease ATP-binding subunit ClpC
MFERFSERARQVIVMAQDEARTLKHHYIGTEHILLGLLHDEQSDTIRALASRGVTLEAARAQIAQIVGPGQEDSPGQIPFTPRAKKVLELALREAGSLRSDHIDAEHILLGLARENDGAAARALANLGVDAEAIRSDVVATLARRGRRAPAPNGSAAFAARLGRLLLEVAAHAPHEAGRPDDGDVLLALARERDGVVGRALTALGTNDERLREAIARARRPPDAQ